jgi:hypothetical protein
MRLHDINHLSCLWLKVLDLSVIAAVFKFQTDKMSLFALFSRYFEHNLLPFFPLILRLSLAVVIANHWPCNRASGNNPIGGDVLSLSLSLSLSTSFFPDYPRRKKRKVIGFHRLTTEANGDIVKCLFRGLLLDRKEMIFLAY